MTELSDEDLEKIIERDMPGYRVTRRTEAGAERASGAEPDATSPDLDALRTRFLGKDAAGSSDAPRDAAPGGAAGDPTEDASDDDEVIVPVEPEAPRDPTDRRSHAKVAVVSNKDRKVIGSQG